MPEQAVQHDTIGRPVVVVGVDGSASSFAALRWALSESSRTAAIVQAAFVFPCDAAETLPGQIDMPTLADDLSIVQLAGDELARAIRRSLGEGALERVATVIIPAETTAKGLALAASRADLLVIGAGGRRGGSVIVEESAIGALREVQCPIVVVPCTDPASLAA